MPKASKKTDRPDSVVLKPNKKTVADALLDGATVREAAAVVGLSLSSAQKIKSASDVRQYLATNQVEISNLTNLKRADIVAGMMDAIDLARLAADPGSMIRGYTEIAKMLGLYAPEVKVVQVSMTQRAIANKYEAMSDEDLLKIAEGQAIEGEFQTVPNEPRQH